MLCCSSTFLFEVDDMDVILHENLTAYLIIFSMSQMKTTVVSSPTGICTHLHHYQGNLPRKMVLGDEILKSNHLALYYFIIIQMVCLCMPARARMCALAACHPIPAVRCYMAVSESRLPCRDSQNQYESQIRIVWRGWLNRQEGIMAAGIRWETLRKPPAVWGPTYSAVTHTLTCCYFHFLDLVITDE